MRWSERQLAMLREMGIRVWAPAAPTAMADAGSATLVAERTPGAGGGVRGGAGGARAGGGL